MVQLLSDDRMSKCMSDEYYDRNVERTKKPPRRAQSKRPRVNARPARAVSEDEHYVTISRTGHGPPRIRSSSSLGLYKEHIVAEALPKFLECLDELSQDFACSARMRSVFGVPAIAQPEAAGVSYPFAPSTKRRRSNSTITHNVSETGVNTGHHGRDRDSHPPEKTFFLHVADTDACREYFRLAFQAIQQIDCRFIAKRWIKKIEPKKQVRHPYNGGRGSPKDPERTKPKWWPPGVTHKEPDHINRNDRIALLTYLIMNTGNDLLTSVDTGVIPTIKDFEEVTRPYTGELKNPKSWGILQDMFKARQYMEAIEYEGWDPETTEVMVVDRCEATRRAQGEPKNVIDDEDEIDSAETRVSEDEEIEDGLDIKPELTPNSSTLPSPILNAHAPQDHSYQDIVEQNRHSYDTTPPATLDMRRSYITRLSHHSYGDLPEYHPPMLVSQYETPNLYANPQPLRHQLYQQMDGSVSAVPPRQDYQQHAIATSQESPISNWAVESQFFYPVQYVGTPSQAPPMQPVMGEQNVFDDGIYQTRQQHDPMHALQYNTPIFNHPPPQFAETRDSNTSRWMAFRPASSTPMPQLTGVTTPTESENSYQIRMRGELQEFS